MNRVECNLLHYIINTPKHAKKSHYCPILHGFTNTRKGGAKFKNFCVLLESGYSSMVVIGRLVETLYPEKYAMIQWHTQAGNITTNIKIKVDFTLPALSTTNVVT